MLSFQDRRDCIKIPLMLRRCVIVMSSENSHTWEFGLAFVLHVDCNAVFYLYYNCDTRLDDMITCRLQLELLSLFFALHSERTKDKEIGPIAKRC